MNHHRLQIYPSVSPSVGQGIRVEKYRVRKLPLQLKTVERRQCAAADRSDESLAAGVRDLGSK